MKPSDSCSYSGIITLLHLSSHCIVNIQSFFQLYHMLSQLNITLCKLCLSLVDLDLWNRYSKSYVKISIYLFDYNVLIRLNHSAVYLKIKI